MLWEVERDVQQGSLSSALQTCLYLTDHCEVFLLRRQFGVKHFINGLKVLIWRLKRRCLGPAQKKHHAGKGSRKSQSAELLNVILTKGKTWSHLEQGKGKEAK